MTSVIKIVMFMFTTCTAARIQYIFTDGPLRKLGSRLYKEELLTDKFNDPKELAYDSASRNLFFMYMDDAIQNSGRAYVNIITKEAMKIKGIEKNKATAIDPESGDVYFGSENGLYKYDPIENDVKNIGLYNINIHRIVIRNNVMYVIDANTHMIYRVYNKYRTVARIGNMKTVMGFEVDNENNVHYVTLCGVYCFSHDHEIVKNNDINMVDHFILDDEKTIGINEEGMYDIDCKNGTAKKLSKIDFFPISITYGDYGEIFYSVDNNIFRLKPVNSYLIYNFYGKPLNIKQKTIKQD